jgi:hypothetical protein
MSTPTLRRRAQVIGRASSRYLHRYRDQKPVSDTGFRTRNRLPTRRADTDSIKKADIDINMDSYYAHHYSIIYLF